MMKKIIALLLCMAALFAALAGCGNKTQEDPYPYGEEHEHELNCNQNFVFRVLMRRIVLINTKI
jgi:ABC-type oligopeptide transport system substrate-binding subunit